MSTASQKIARVAIIVGLCSLVVVVVRAQTPGQSSRKPAQGPSNAQMMADRDKIWNSPNMLRARAWLQDYCSKSAKITPQMAKHYQDELEHMTPSQMQLWLLKFDHEEEQRQQQYAMFQQQHQIALSHAQAANRATQRSLNEFNQEQNKAADEEEQQIQEQREFSQSEAQENQENSQAMPFGAYPYSGYGVFPGYGGGIHYHFHYYQ